jgi:hypothetical protein
MHARRSHVQVLHADIRNDLDDLVLGHELHLRQLIIQQTEPALNSPRLDTGWVTSAGEKTEMCRSVCPAMGI